MQYGLISIFTVQIARLLGLVRTVVVVRLDGTPHPMWTLLIKGRGFSRILRNEPLMSPYLLRTVDPIVSRPMQFLTYRAAMAYAQSVGLMAKQTSWRVSQP